MFETITAERAGPGVKTALAYDPGLAGLNTHAGSITHDGAAT